MTTGKYFSIVVQKFAHKQYQSLDLFMWLKPPTASHRSSLTHGLVNFTYTYKYTLATLTLGVMPGGRCLRCRCKVSLDLKPPPLAAASGNSPEHEFFLPFVVVKQAYFKSLLQRQFSYKLAHNIRTVLVFVYFSKGRLGL